MSSADSPLLHPRSRRVNRTLRDIHLTTPRGSLSRTAHRPEDVTA